MSTIDEVLAAAEVVDAVCVIDGETRIISVPNEYKELGVESDEKVTRIKFRCPKIVGDNVDLTEYNLYINYRNAGNKLNSYLVEDVTVADDVINFSWLLSRHVTESPGTISYIVCAKKSDDTGVINEWNTKVATGTVGIGLEATEEIEEQNIDAIEQILRSIVELENKVDSGVGGGSGGYYAPSIDDDGNLTWTASKADMPDVSGTNIKGPQGVSGVYVGSGDMPDGYNVQIDPDGTPSGIIPTIDETLTERGKAADAKATGDAISALTEEKVSLPKDTDGNVIHGTVGWYAVSDGAGGITWVESAPSTGGGGETTTHGIVWNLVNVTSSNNAVSVADGASLIAVLTPADGYTLGDVTITMGGEVVTGAWNADTATVTIQSVTGDVVISCAGVEQTGPVDTSPVIAGYDMSLDSVGSASTTTGGCYTDFYAIPDGASSVVLYSADAEGVSFTSNGKLQYWNDAEFLEYWSTAVNLNTEKSYTLKSGATRFRTSLAINGIDDSYAYDRATGYIYFAGANTKYYGMANIDGTLAGGGSGGTGTANVAEEVDNQVAMLSLSTGETVDTSAYSGLSADYVAMVQSNYDAMMAECLGDYNKIPIIVHTDQHGRIGASNQVMKLIGDMVNWYEVSKCINLGDTVPDRFDMTTLDNYLSATKDSIPLSKRLDVYGNHDVWDSDDSQKYTVDQKRLSPYFKNIYARRHGNNGYFTVVDDYYNVKYLVISDLEYPDTNYSTRRITTAQAKFIVSELSADDGRDVVLVSHVPLDSDEVTSRDSTYQAYSEKFLFDTTAHNSFMTMIAARKNKTSGTFTDSEGISHTYDFSNVSGDLLMSLHGHAHFEAYRTFENSITEFIFDWFYGNTFYFAYIDRKEKKFKVWKNEANVGALEISIA